MVRRSSPNDAMVSYSYGVDERCQAGRRRSGGRRGARRTPGPRSESGAGRREFRVARTPHGPAGHRTPRSRSDGLRRRRCFLRAWSGDSDGHAEQLACGSFGDNAVLPWSSGFVVVAVGEESFGVVVGVGAGCPRSRCGGWYPFGVAFAFLRVVQPFSASLLSIPQARVRSLMSVRWVRVQPWTWWTWLW